MIESGRRKLDSIEVLVKLCEVLHIDNPADVIDWRIRHVSDSKQAYELRELRQLIIGNPALAVLHPEGLNEEFDRHAIGADLQECQYNWIRSPRRYSTLARRLPTVLRTCRDAEWCRPGTGFEELLVETYQLAGQVFSSYGDHNSAATVTDRAMIAAAHTHRPELIFASSWFVGNALLQSSGPVECHDYTLEAANRLSNQLPDTTDDAAVWGALHLTAANAAGLAQDLDESRRLLALSEKIANKLQVDQVGGACHAGNDSCFDAEELLESEQD